MSFKAFVDIAKHTYVDVAADEFGIPERRHRSSASPCFRASPARKCSGCSTRPWSTMPSGREVQRAARVVAGWIRDPEFSDAEGNPKSSPSRKAQAAGGRPSPRWARRFSGDISVSRRARRVTSRRRRREARRRRHPAEDAAYVPESGDADKLNILGTDVSDLVATIDHNLQHGAPTRSSREK